MADPTEPQSSSTTAATPRPNDPFLPSPEVHLSPQFPVMSYSTGRAAARPNAVPLQVTYPPPADYQDVAAIWPPWEGNAQGQSYQAQNQSPGYPPPTPKNAADNAGLASYGGGNPYTSYHSGFSGVPREPEEEYDDDDLAKKYSTVDATPSFLDTQRRMLTCFVLSKKAMFRQTAPAGRTSTLEGGVGCP